MAAASDLRNFLIFLVTIASFSLSASAVSGGEEASLPSTMCFNSPFRGFPASFRILSVSRKPTQPGISPMLLFSKERTRKDFISFISSGTLMSLLRLRSRISNWGSLQICHNQNIDRKFVEEVLTALGNSLNRLARKFKYFSGVHSAILGGICQIRLCASCSLKQRFPHQRDPSFRAGLEAMRHSPSIELPLHVHFQDFHYLLRYSFYGLMTQIDGQLRFDSFTNFLVASQGPLNPKSSCLHGFLKNMERVR